MGATGVEQKNASVWRAHDSVEVASVEAGQLGDAESFGHGDQRGVHEVEPETGVDGHPP